MHQRASLLASRGAAFFSVMLAMVPLIGAEHNGARRWIALGVGELQPSEFLKPLFVVSLAWLLSLKQHDKSLPVAPLSFVSHRGHLRPPDEAARFRAVGGLLLTCGWR